MAIGAALLNVTRATTLNELNLNNVTLPMLEAYSYRRAKSSMHLELESVFGPDR